MPATPKFTAVRSTKVGPKHTTRTVTVYDARGRVTDTRNSRTMDYVEVLVGAEGGIIAASQKVGGTPKNLGGTRVAVTPEATLTAEREARAAALDAQIDPAEATDDPIPTDARLEDVLGGPEPKAPRAPKATDEERKARRAARRKARREAMTPEQLAAHKETRALARARRRAARKAQGAAAD